jgi:hypothetical protein
MGLFSPDIARDFEVLDEHGATMLRHAMEHLEHEGQG